MSGKDGGYLLPEVVDPPRISLCIEIPNEMNHILAFWGALDTLTWSRNWQRDEAHTAAEVSRVWGNVIAQARARFESGEECMPFDPCCPDEIERLDQLIAQNTTIINNQLTFITNQETTISNQLTLIDNSETVIEQNDTEIVQNYINTYNQWVYNNEQISILNQQLYDGTPQSIHPDVPVDGWSIDAATRDALCLACTRYLEQVLATLNSALALTTAGAVAASSTAIALGLALSVVTLGGSVAVGIAVAGFIAAGNLVMESIINNPEAQRKVLCCMFDTLKDQPVTLESFKTIGTDCTDENDPNVATLADMVHHASQVESNYLGFLRMLGESQGFGNENDCFCCDDAADFEIVSLNGCVITRINDFQWRIQQSVGVAGPGDPFCSGGYDYYTAEFKESEGRCIDIIAAGAMAGWEQIDCAGNLASGVGGGGGQGTWFKWFTKACPPDTTEFDMIITIACPVDQGIVP